MVNVISDINGKINGFVWGLPMMVLILGVGVYLSLCCGFPQFAHFGHIMKNTLGKAFEKSEKKKVRFHHSRQCVLHLQHRSVPVTSPASPVPSQSVVLVPFSGCGFLHFLVCAQNSQK